MRNQLERSTHLVHAGVHCHPLPTGCIIGERVKRVSIYKLFNGYPRYIYFYVCMQRRRKLHWIGKAKATPT